MIPSGSLLYYFSAAVINALIIQEEVYFGSQIHSDLTWRQELEVDVHIMLKIRMKSRQRLMLFASSTECSLGSKSRKW